MLNKLLHNRYQIQYQIGQGGWNDIYLVKDIHLQTLCVIKTIRTTLNEKQQRFGNKMLQSEAAILKKITHDNIPKILDLFEEEDEFYLVMEYIEGTSLYQLLIQNKINEKQRIKWLKECLDVLQYLHENNIMFGDLKPENIMIKDNRVYLIDFGSAWIKGTYQKVKSGTMFYYTDISRGEEAFDIYSYGKLFYELYTKDHSNQMNQLKKLKRNKQSFIKKCTGKNKYYQTMKQVKIGFMLRQYKIYTVSFVLFMFVIFICLVVGNLFEGRNREACYYDAMNKESYKEAILCNTGKYQAYENYVKQLYTINKEKDNKLYKYLVDQNELLLEQQEIKPDKEVYVLMGMLCMYADDLKYYQKAERYFRQSKKKDEVTKLYLDLTKLLAQSNHMNEMQQKEFLDILKKIQDSLDTIIRKELRKENYELLLHLYFEYHELIPLDELNQLEEFLIMMQDLEIEERKEGLDKEFNLWQKIAEENQKRGVFDRKPYEYAFDCIKNIEHKKEDYLNQGYLKLNEFLYGIEPDYQKNHKDVLIQAKTLFEKVTDESNIASAKQGIAICNQQLDYYEMEEK